MQPSKSLPFTREWLSARGFTGFRTFSELPTAGVPKRGGIYVVVREQTAAPEWLEVSSGGWLKGKDPTVPLSTLARRWVPAAPVLYIGKADARGRRHLQKRLDEYRQFGAGEPVRHWGGRLIWQLADVPACVVAWRLVDHHPVCREREFVRRFEHEFNQPPFANIGAMQRCPEDTCGDAVAL